MHDVRKTLDRVQLLHLNRAKIADFAQIVATEIHEHVVFGKLFFVREKLLLKRLVFCGRAPAPARTSERIGVEDVVFELHKGFGRSTCDLEVVAREVKHVRGRIDLFERLVGAHEIALVRGA